MWKQQKLQLSPQAKTALENALQGINSPFSLSATGTKLGVHNWSHGIEEKSNRYLSPENAVKALSAKLTDYTDPNRPKGEQDVIVIMVAETNIDVFIEKLNQVRVILDEPVFRQALDYAKASKDLQATKMVKTPTQASPAFGNSADITPSTARTMQSILRQANSGTVQAFDPQQAIAQLMQMKAENQRKKQQKATALLNAQAQVQGFVARGELEQVAISLQTAIPKLSAVFTVALMYVGADLSAIKGMLNDH